jgi:hypothetical protein
MTAPGEALRRPRKRLVTIALFALAVAGLAASGTSYLRYASVWLRKPPGIPKCVYDMSRLLRRDEPVTGSIPHMTPDGRMVYLRKFEDHAVNCVKRVSSDVGSELVAAFAETEPGPRRVALREMARRYMAKDPSADREARVAYVIAAGALRALPKDAETDAAGNELDSLNACRFQMPRSQCATRPPVPIVVWVAGVPSSLVLTFGLGWGAKSLFFRARDWWLKRKAKRAEPKKVVEEPREDGKP